VTDERAAVRLVRGWAAPGRLRVLPDAEGWPRIPGRLGQIEWHCDGTDCHGCPAPGPLLAVFTTRARLHARLLALPGVRRWQRGDQEMRALFPLASLPAVAAVIGARRRAVPVMTPARLASLAAAREKLRGACPSATSRAQEPILTGTPA